MLRQKLGQKLLQKLSPQQIQLMKLLQLPTDSLEERIKEELEANPALDEGENPSESDMQEGEAMEAAYTNEGDDAEASREETEEEIKDPYDEIDINELLPDEDEASYKVRDHLTNGTDEETRNIPYAVDGTFHEFLMEQAGMLDLSDRDMHIVAQIIGSIDDDGYLRRETSAIVDDLSFSQNLHTEDEEVEDLLEIVQKFDPSGTGARTLQECLLIQVRRKVTEEGDNSKELEIAEDLLENHFEEFTKKHYDRLKRNMGINTEELKGAIDEILKLNPKPGATYSNSTKPENYIIPDFFIANSDGRLELTLNGKNAPDLHVSDTYRSMLKDYSKSKKKNKEAKEAVMFIKQKIDSAKWFIDAIKQRQQTMLKTMNAILNYQYDYFLSGDEMKLKPMILKDIADITALDISTISRVSNSKFVQTEFGTFKLKSFFSESLQTDSGEEVSTREVKKILQDFIEAENKRKPLSDQKLTVMLLEKGYNIARRTVAKYREQMNIPVARLRKQL